MDEEIETLIVRVRADTQGFARDGDRFGQGAADVGPFDGIPGLSGRRSGNEKG